MTLKVGDALVNRDNTPITVRQLKDLLTDVPEKYLDKPVLMYSDEEGNSVGKLYALGIERDGLILTPADAS